MNFFSPTHKLAVDGIKNPKQSADIESQWECESSENIVSDLSDKRSITGCRGVGAGKVVDKCKGEVNGLCNLKIDKNDLETRFYRCKHWPRHSPRSGKSNKPIFRHIRTFGKHSLCPRRCSRCKARTRSGRSPPHEALCLESTRAL